LGAEPSTDEYIAIATSRTFLEQFVSDHALLPVLFEENWDPVGKQWHGASTEHPTAADGARMIQRELLEVRSDPDSGLVRLSIVWTERELAAEWTNEIVRRLNEAARTRAIAQAELSLEFLRTQLESANQVSIRDAINAVIESQMQKIMLARVQGDYAFRIVDPAVPARDSDFVSPRRLLVVTFSIVGILLAAISWMLLDARLSTGNASAG
jgi:uncharacterized protein involved in exopolysaccharide biosynthesis